MENFPGKIAPANLTLAHTLTQIQGAGLVGGAFFGWAVSSGAIFRPRRQFYGRQFFGHNLNSAFQTKIYATSFVE